MIRITGHFIETGVNEAAPCCPPLVSAELDYSVRIPTSSPIAAAFSFHNLRDKTLKANRPSVVAWSGIGVSI